MINKDNLEDQYSKKLITKLIQLNSTSKEKVDIKEVKKAIIYVKKYHLNQKRLSGEPYYIHPLEVAIIVSDFLFDTESIIAALLHDTIEDTRTFLPQIALLFSKNIESLIDILSKMDSELRKIRLLKHESMQKLMQEGLVNKKALLVKLADRLHNMRTIGYIPSKEKQKRIALETIESYVPLAKYLGIQEIEQELSNIAIKILNS